MATKKLAGLDFQAHSPSLYTLEIGGGMVLIEYRGGGAWRLDCIRADLPPDPHYFSSLVEIERLLEMREAS